MNLSEIEILELVKSKGNSSLIDAGERYHSRLRMLTEPLNAQQLEDETAFDELRAHFQMKAAETVVLSTVALPGVDSTLRELHNRGYRLAIATTKIKCPCTSIKSNSSCKTKRICVYT